MKNRIIFVAFLWICAFLSLALFLVSCSLVEKPPKLENGFTVIAIRPLNSGEYSIDLEGSNDGIITQFRVTSDTAYQLGTKLDLLSEQDVQGIIEIQMIKSDTVLNRVSKGGSSKQSKSKSGFWKTI